MSGTSGYSGHSSGNPTAKEHFDQAVVRHHGGDIKKLLDAKLDVAGPLLNSVVNAIDTIGGIHFGFATGSTKRSVDIMTKFLKMPEELAHVMYDNVRCGFGHQGNTKYGVEFTANYHDDDPAFAKTDGKNIYINLASLAKLLLSVIEKFTEADMKDAPTVGQKTKEMQEAAVKKLPPLNAAKGESAVDGIKVAIAETPSPLLGSGPIGSGNKI